MSSHTSLTGPSDIDPYDRRSQRQVRERRTSEISSALATCQDDEECRRLQEELVAVNMPVAEAIARRYGRRGIEDDDLRQIAYLALTKSAQRFDASIGTSFLFYCVPTIRGEIRRYFRDHGWAVRPPRRIQELQQRLSATQAELSATRGGTPSEQELAEALGEDLAAVREAMNCSGCFAPTSLDAIAGHGSTAIGELFGEEDSAVGAAEARAVLGPLVRALSERDRQILNLRFFEDLTQREVAEHIGVTQMQVSRLLSRIYRDLRVRLDADAVARRGEQRDAS